MLVNRLKQLTEQKHRVVEQEHEITDEQIEIQAILEAKARERERAMEQSPPNYSAGEPEPEALPVPAAMIHDQQHPGKRHGVNAVSCEYSPPLVLRYCKGGMFLRSPAWKRVELYSW